MDRKELLEQLVEKEGRSHTVQGIDVPRTGKEKGGVGEKLLERLFPQTKAVIDRTDRVSRQVERVLDPDYQQQEVSRFLKGFWDKHRGTITGALSLAGMVAGTLLLSRMHRDRPAVATRDRARRPSILDRGLFRSI